MSQETYVLFSNPMRERALWRQVSECADFVNRNPSKRFGDRLVCTIRGSIPTRRPPKVLF